MANNTNPEHPEDRGEVNDHGDKIITTTGSHGVDVSSQRLDRLDKEALRYALDLNLYENSPSAVDLGCGLGSQGVRFSLLGMETTLIDIHDVSNRIELLSDLFDIGSLRFLQKDVQNLRSEELPENISLLHSQRFVHYLEFGDARDLFSLLANQMHPSGRVFVSASGLHSELGEGYADRDVPLEDRYSELSPTMSERHDIRDSVCLYSADDMERLLTESGFQMLEVTTSDFGNIKAIAERE
jgi:hypothetical protein